MTAKLTSKVILSGLLAISGGFIVAGCSGDTDGGPAGDETFEGSQFVGDESTGSIEVRVNNTALSVGNTSGFIVRVRDGSGNPVPLTRVSCDSENGVAVLEPSSGTEISDAGGNISGVLGCERQGSYLFGCRLAVGANKRAFVTIRCSAGDDDTFDFPNSGGGNLGGGTGGSGVGAEEEEDEEDAA